VAISAAYFADDATQYESDVLHHRLAMSEDFHHLRRILAQISGFLLLCKRPSPHTSVGIDVSVREYEATLREVVDRLSALRMPKALSASRTQCLECAAALGEACASLRAGLGRVGREFERAFDALPHLRRAHRLLRAAADEQAGMPLVSYCACCAGLGLRAPLVNNKK
jgi:hypothetical protein